MFRCRARRRNRGAKGCLGGGRHMEGDAREEGEEREREREKRGSGVAYRR